MWSVEEVKEEGDDYQVKWGQLFGKYFVDKNSEFWVNEETGELRSEKPDILKPDHVNV